MSSSPRRAEFITDILLDNTVLQKWLEPMKNALDKVRYKDTSFYSLPMLSFILIGGLRQILAIKTLRAQVQALFHMNEYATQLPLARSTWSDALKSASRRNILREAISHLVVYARSVLTDRLEGVEGIGERAVLAIDATYQNESSHFYRVTPKEGGDDNPKKHMHMMYYDIRHGIPLNVKIETASKAEMPVLEKNYAHKEDWGRIRHAIYVVDRAFIKGAYWDEKKAKDKATVITRMKSTLNYVVVKERKVSKHLSNEKVISDHTIVLDSSGTQWRLIQWLSPDATVYEYLSNDFSLEPGVIAFLYLRRWDEEKYFDNFKNDLANEKAWGKSAIAIEQQALMGMMCYLLTRLFIKDSAKALGLAKEDNTQKRKQDKKIEQYMDAKEGVFTAKGIGSVECDVEELLPRYDAYRAFFAYLSKITRQVWRFLENCFRHKPSQRLYEAQLRPLLERYL